MISNDKSEHPHSNTFLGAEFDEEADILLKVLSNAKEYKHLEEGIPILIDTLVLMLHAVTESVIVSHAAKTLAAVKAALSFMMKGLKSADFVRVSNILTFI